MEAPEAAMQRREFFKLLGGATAAWPLAARAQKPEGVRRIGMLSEFSEQDMQPLLGTFKQVLQRLGWSEDGIRIDFRVTGVNAAQFHDASAALVATAPDVIVTLGSRATGFVKEATPTTPVVFTLVSDPVEQGLVKSLVKPGGNLTGVTNYEFSFAGKWLDALKNIEPRISRVLLMVNPQNPGTLALSRFVEGLGPSHGVVMVRAPVRNIADIESALALFGEGIDRAIIVLPDDLFVDNRDLIIRQINSARIPVVFPFPEFAVSGGLLSWGLDFVGVFRQAATYVDRILRGAKPADIPIEAPNKFNIIINLKTANALKLKIPSKLLALADEVIE
jgi:putative ABC transport system substrate-binding protein